VTLLIVLALAGLRGNVLRPKWTGSHAVDIGFGIVLFVVFSVLLAITTARRQAGLRKASTAEDGSDQLSKLRAAIMVVLTVGLVADIAAAVYSLHLKLPKAKPRKATTPTAPTVAPSTAKTQTPHSGHGSLPIADILWGLLILVLIAAIVLTLRWLASQSRVRGWDGADDEIAEDSQTLREAVESGRSALRTFDDAKSAIIACYLAMERSLAEQGAARTDADTPDELLARANQRQIVRGTAPARLTALFYEARFSSHPMDQAQRDAAEQALDELARALDSQHRDPQQAGA